MQGRALVLKSAGLEALAIEERAAADPGPGEVVLRMRASCLNYHDFAVLKGFIPTMSYPRVPLSDGAGEVVAVGPGVSRVAIGDRVCPNFFRDWVAGRPNTAHWGGVFGDTIDGCASEHLVVPEHCLAKVPGHLSDLEAATLPCAGLTAWNAIATPGLAAGETVLLQGTGGVSIYALQFAKAMGARVIITSSSDEKLARARELGADCGINYREHPDWEQQVLEATGGGGADLIIDVGGQDTLPRSVTAAAPGGRIALVGVLSGFGAAAFNPALTFPKQLALHGIAVGSREHFDAMNRCIEQNGIQPVISDVFALEDTAKAAELMERGGHFGKIAISID